jgi:hypothetical protein
MADQKQIFPRRGASSGGTPKKTARWVRIVIFTLLQINYVQNNLFMPKVHTMQGTGSRDFYYVFGFWKLSQYCLMLHKLICGIVWRACNLTSFSPCLTGPVDYLFASCHKGLRFQSPGGNLYETGILLLALSHCNSAFIFYLQVSF